MGKRIRAQRKGRGSIFRAKTYGRIEDPALPALDARGTGTVTGLLHEPGRGAPLAKIRTESGKVFHIVAPEGLRLGQRVDINQGTSPSVGDVLELSAIPAGTQICSVEKRAGDGGMFAKSSGAFAQVIGTTPKGIEVRLPSGKTKTLSPRCRAMIGVVSGSGRTAKPLLKYGKKFHWFKAKRGKGLGPIVRGVAMNPVDHPFGGGAKQHIGKPKTVSRHAPPGRKVGSFAARSTGRRRRRRRTR
ncbi:MAG: 50S ribosomal protein L2 [Candidatus Geothermarchaeales archaeon]